MSLRGVLYIVWGEAEGLLHRSIDSVRQTNPALPIKVEWVPKESNLLVKSKMDRWSPFDTTLYLDADTVVMGDLSYGFESAERHGLSCCICECPHAKRYKQMPATVEYNTGVMFWKKSKQTTELFEHWQRSCELDSSIEWFDPDGTHRRMETNDQGPFSRAVYETGFNPHVLPINWNFRHRWHKSWFGSIKIWHDYDDPRGQLTERHPMEFFISG
ncbi:hypothetical protein EBZ39_03660 [bacterium]|nr:hypothetical protein [bacterium]